MCLKHLSFAVFSLVMGQSTFAIPYDQTRCLDVKLGGNVSYRTCRHYEDPRKEIYLDEYKNKRAVTNIRSKIESQVRSAWHPPMGYSGYLIDISYGLDDKGYLTYLEVNNSNISDEFVEGIIDAFKRFEPYPNNPDVAESLKNNKMQIRIN